MLACGQTCALALVTQYIPTVRVQLPMRCRVAVDRQNGVQKRLLSCKKCSCVINALSQPLIHLTRTDAALLQLWPADTRSHSCMSII
jgi:hypothetical protein